MCPTRFRCMTMNRWQTPSPPPGNWCPQTPMVTSRSGRTATTLPARRWKPAWLPPPTGRQNRERSLPQNRSSSASTGSCGPSGGRTRQDLAGNSGAWSLQCRNRPAEMAPPGAWTPGDEAGLFPCPGTCLFGADLQGHPGWQEDRGFEFHVPRERVTPGGPHICERAGREVHAVRYRSPHTEGLGREHAEVDGVEVPRDSRIGTARVHAQQPQRRGVRCREVSPGRDGCGFVDPRQEDALGQVCRNSAPMDLAGAGAPHFRHDVHLCPCTVAAEVFHPGGHVKDVGEQQR